MLPEEEKFSLEPKSNPAMILPNASTVRNKKQVLINDNAQKKLLTYFQICV